MITVKKNYYSLPVDEQVVLWNDYCAENNYDNDQICDFDEYFFQTFFEGRPMESAQATHFGSVNWNDEFVVFDSYGNLKSISKGNIENHIDEERLFKWIKENK